MTNPNPAPWPEGRSGAVSVTFDDGSDSQLQQAVPLLDERGLRATFYLIPTGERWERNRAGWQAAAARGHEMGNHTLSHICARGFRDTLDGPPTLDTVSLDKVEADILAAEERLRGAFPDHGPRSFAYPCYMSHVGTGPGRVSYVPLVAKHFVAGRGRGEFANHPLTADRHHLWSWPAERLHHWDLIGMAETCAAQGRWGIFTFHGIGDGHLPIARYDLAQFLDHLERRQDCLWTAPVAEVASAIVDWRERTAASRE